MEAWWATLLREQRSAGFPDVAGAHASVTLPVSDRLITRLVSERLPAAPISRFDLAAEAGSQVVVRARLARLSFVPPIRVRLFIERQPDLPESPVVVLRIASEGIAALASIALGVVKVLPPGVLLEGNLIHVNVATLLASYGAAEAFSYLTRLRVTTEHGLVVVEAQARLPDNG